MSGSTHGTTLGVPKVSRRIVRLTTASSIRPTPVLAIEALFDLDARSSASIALVANAPAAISYLFVLIAT